MAAVGFKPTPPQRPRPLGHATRWQLPWTLHEPLGAISYHIIYSNLIRQPLLSLLDLCTTVAYSLFVFNSTFRNQLHDFVNTAVVVTSRNILVYIITTWYVIDAQTKLCYCLPKFQHSMVRSCRSLWARYSGLPFHKT